MGSQPIMQFKIYNPCIRFLISENSVERQRDKSCERKQCEETEVVSTNGAKKVLFFILYIEISSKGQQEELNPQLFTCSFPILPHVIEPILNDFWSLKSMIKFK